MFQDTAVVIVIINDMAQSTLVLRPKMMMMFSMKANSHGFFSDDNLVKCNI